MDKKIVLIIGLIFCFACKKQCYDNNNDPIPLPNLYYNWFANHKDTTINYISRSSDNLYQSFSIRSYLSHVYDLKKTDKVSCDLLIGESMSCTLTNSIYPFTIEYGIRHKSYISDIECYMNYYYYNTKSHDSYNEHYSCIISNNSDSGLSCFYDGNYPSNYDTCIAGNFQHLSNYTNSNGLNFTDLFRIDLIGSRFINFSDYPLYIVISTKYGLIEYKEKGGRIWSVSKL